MCLCVRPIYVEVPFCRLAVAGGVMMYVSPFPCVCRVISHGPHGVTLSLIANGKLHQGEHFLRAFLV